MKRFLQLKNISYMALFAGIVGFLLRLWLHSTRGADGFVAKGHISGILLFLLTAGGLAALFWACCYFRQANKCDFNFPPSLLAGIGSGVGAMGILAVSLAELVTAQTTVEWLTALIGLVAAAALGFAAYGRWKGQRLSVVFYCVISVYLMLRLFSMYRAWCADPQLEDYLYELLALACGVIASYHRAAFNADFGSRRSYAFFNLATVYFCCLSLAGDSMVFYLALGAWMFADPCSFNPLPKDLWGKNP